MKDLVGKLAVLTGAASGIGRELARQLVGEGCHIAIGDIDPYRLEETVELCNSANPRAVTITALRCDVADEAAVRQFVDDTRSRHATDHIDLLINNAGITGGGSFVEDSREEWERTFNICWSGVYLMTRNFLPLLLKSREGHLVNMSSANGLRAVLGGHVPHTAYSTAKFAVRGFSEALIHDFRFNAPHLHVSVVMPGHTDTNIVSNSLRVLGREVPERSDTQSTQVSGMAPAEAARVILEGVKRKQWRILIGSDTRTLDRLVRESPESAYDPDFVDRWREANRKYSDPGS